MHREMQSSWAQHSSVLKLLSAGMCVHPSHAAGYLAAKERLDKRRRYRTAFRQNAASPRAKRSLGVYKFSAEALILQGIAADL